MLTLFASSITNKLYILQKKTQCSGSTNTIRVNKQVSVDMNIPIKRATTKEKSEFDLQKINNAEERKTKLIAAIFVKHKTKIK